MPVRFETDWRYVTPDTPVLRCATALEQYLEQCEDGTRCGLNPDLMRVTKHQGEITANSRVVAAERAS